MATRLNIEVVKQAINELIAQGIKPTNQNIVSHLGYGSYSTLTILRREYPSVFGVSPKRIVNTENTVQNTVEDSLINTVWQRIETRIDERVQTVLNTKYSTTESDSVFLSKIKALEAENQDLKVRLDDKEDDNVARLRERTFQRNELKAKVEQFKERNVDLESKLEAVQSEAQTNIDSLNQKLSEAKREIQRQSTEYNNLHQKYIALKADIFDGNAPVKATSRTPLTLDGEAKVKYIIDTDKAKERVIELTKEGLDHKEITQQLESEGYRTKGLLGDVKPYLQSNIGKWQRKFKQKGSI